MIDVILYGKDRRGRLTLKEHRFASLGALSSFFLSPKAARWEWAEVEVSAERGSKQIIHYTADALRGLIVSSYLEPSLN